VLLVLGLVMACQNRQEKATVRQWTAVDSQAALQTGTPAVTQFQFPSKGHHCSSWAGVIFLEVHEQRSAGRVTLMQFLRDPEQKILVPRMQAFATAVSLPEDAVWSGWRDGDREFWLTADRSAAFVGSGVHWERWPAPPYEIGCD
jgi:hypothetical protein